ncbi:MAG: hypothetical protein ABFD75_12235 [Smithella sp.]
MKKGYVRISLQLIKDALKLPVEWEIWEMEFDYRNGNIVALISGNDFPECGEGKAKECTVLCHRESIRFEVEEITG